MDFTHLLKNEKAKAVLNIVTVVFSMIVSMCIGFFLTPYIVKHLGVEANGFIQLSTNFTMYAGLITITVNSMGGRFISIAYHKGDIDKANSYYSSMIFANMWIALGLLIPFALSVVFIDSFIQIDAKLLSDARILFSLIFTNFYATQFIGLISVNIFVSNKLYITNTINGASHIVRGCILLALFTFFSAHMFFTSLTWVCISIISILVYLRLRKEHIPELKFYKAKVQVSRILELIKSGIWNTINQCGNILMTGLDLLLANIFVDPVQMGILATGKVVPGILISMAANINNSLSPTMMISYARDNTKEVLSQIRYAAKLGIFCLVIPIITFCVYGQDFFQLWVPSLDTKQLWIVSLLTLMAYIPLAGTQTLYNVLSSMNKLSYNSILFVSFGVINVVAVYFTLKNTDLGIFAIAGISSALTIVRNLIFILPYIASLLKVKWYSFYYYVYLALLSSVLTAGVAYGVKHFLGIHDWQTLVLSVLVTVVLITVLNFFVLLSKAERDRIMNSLTFIKK